MFGRMIEARGRAFRENLVLATKTGFSVGQGPNDVGLSRKHIFQAITSSLEDLQTPYVDIFYAHTWDSGTPLKETLAAFNDLVRSGKIHYVGLSNFTGWQVQKAVDLCELYNFAVRSSSSVMLTEKDIACIQPQYNLLDRYPEYEQIPVCRNEGATITHSNLIFRARIVRLGSTLRRMADGQVPPRCDCPNCFKSENGLIQQNTRVSLEITHGFKHNSFDFKGNERTWAVLDKLEQIAAARQKTMSAVAINWLKDAPGVTAPILGPRTVAQLNDCLGGIGWRLTDEERASLDEASTMPAMMPQMFVDVVNAGRERRFPF